MIMIDRVARAISPELWETQDGLKENSPDYWAMPTQVELRKTSRERAIRIVEIMRHIPDMAYDNYRCDELWRNLNSVKVLNLWIDAALKETA